MPQNHNFFSLIEPTLQRHENEVLLTKTSTNNTQLQWTGKEIKDKISCFQQLLLSKKVKLQEKIAIAISIEDGLMEAVLACMASGITPVVPPAGMSKSDLIKLLKKQKIERIIISQNSSWLSLLSLQLLGIKVMKPSSNPLRNVNQTVKKVEYQYIALVSYSSGSTGQPKPIFRTHGLLIAQHQAIKKVFSNNEGLLDFPLFPNVLLHNLACGTKTLFPDIEGLKIENLEPSKIIHQLKNNPVYSMTGNVHYFSKLMCYIRTKGIILPEIKAIGIGGSPVSEKLLMQIKTHFIEAEVFVIYGSTEAEPVSVRKYIPKIIDPTQGYDVGIVHPDLEVKLDIIGSIIVHPHEHAVGEILVKGHHVMANEEGWLRTGDFGYMIDNQLFLTGRKGNEKIYLQHQHYQVEHFIHNLEGVDKVAAIYHEEGFKVYFEGTAMINEITNCCKSRFPEGIIQTVQWVSEIPVDARHRSKILYAKLS